MLHQDNAFFLIVSLILAQVIIARSEEKISSDNLVTVNLKVPK